MKILDAQTAPPSELSALADRLHSAAIHLLRRVRRDDPESGLSSSRLSALSVVVFAGPLTLGELARAEQVSSPTITGLVAGLEGAGLVKRERDPDDRRIYRVRATAAGRRLLSSARQRRVANLTVELRRFSGRQRKQLHQAAELLLGIGSEDREAS